MREALKDLQAGKIQPKMMEMLLCPGCIRGDGLTGNMSMPVRHKHIIEMMNTRRVNVSDRNKNNISETVDLKWTFPNMENCAPPADVPDAEDELQRAIKGLQDSGKRLNTTQEVLQHSEKLANLAQLTTAMAYKLNNPLSVILMYAHIMKDEHRGNEALFQDLEILADQADKCKRIINDLLNISRKNRVLHEPVDVRELIDRTLMIIPVRDGISVHVEHTVDNPSVDLDKEQVVHLLNHLVTNAYEAMDGGGHLYIRTEGDAESVRFIIKDTGPGIKKFHLSKIFDPFFTTKKVGFGSGLGLAVTYRIVKMHNGEISVNTNTDPRKGPTGTEFILTFPRLEGNEGIKGS